jgi:carbamoyltransferase
MAKSASKRITDPLWLGGDNVQLTTLARMHILGLSCWYHDAAACLLRDGRIVAAAQEERFSREKYDASFPEQAIQYCLNEGDVEVDDLDLVAFYDKPLLKFERLLETYVAYAPAGLRSFLTAMPIWLEKKLWIPDRIADALGYDGTILFPEHHESHAASAFYPSPFDQAAFLTVDGVGEWTTTTYGQAHGRELQIQSELRFPHSLGLLYSAFTYFCGFRVNGGEYKLMGLAPYGEPRFVDTIHEDLLDLKPDGSFRLNMDYFCYPHSLRMTGRRFADLFEGPRREPESELTQRELDMARSVQEVTEEILLRMVRHVHRETGDEHLCLAGGVALNCVANGRILREGPFERIWIQPAAGDAGGALGAAYVAWHDHAGKSRPVPIGDAMQGTYLGPGYSEKRIRDVLDDTDGTVERVGHEALPERTARLLDEGNVVGWFQGRMEFGPRALGHRSILADPRRSDMQRVLNQKIKFRESFRPFAPSVLEAHASDYFEIDAESPYMLLVTQVHGAQAEGEGLDRLHNIDSPLPAVTHVNGSARLQTVTEDRSPRYYRLLSAFEQRTGCPVLVNTSLNVRGEPIVCTPTDAVQCFEHTQMDALAIGPFLVTASGGEDE